MNETSELTLLGDTPLTQTTEMKASNLTVSHYENVFTLLLSAPLHWLLMFNQLFLNKIQYSGLNIVLLNLLNMEVSRLR